MRCAHLTYPPFFYVYNHPPQNIKPIDILSTCDILSVRIHHTLEVLYDKVPRAEQDVSPVQ